MHPQLEKAENPHVPKFQRLPEFPERGGPRNSVIIIYNMRTTLDFLEIALLHRTSTTTAT